jgi:hypothetical protein
VSTRAVLSRPKFFKRVLLWHGLPIVQFFLSTNSKRLANASNRGIGDGSLRSSAAREFMADKRRPIE